MVSKDLLLQVIYEQRETHVDLGVTRQIDDALVACPEILVISGVRRCGKSVLLRQIQARQPVADYYLSFDDERLMQFTVADFAMLAQVFIEEFGEQRLFCFDEIQNVPGWERFVSRLYSQGNKVIVTGSNASLLSRELGTFLTGRHVDKRLFPFSFAEFLAFEGHTCDRSTFHTTAGRAMMSKWVNEYLRLGGFPQYLRNRNGEYLQTLYADIVYRDIVARHGLDSARPLRELVYYLASNGTHRFTYNSVAKATGIKSSDMVKSYIGFLEDTFLVFVLNKFDNKAGVQLRSPKKIYFIDNALQWQIGFNASPNTGMLLENAVCIELLRKGCEVYYYGNGHECDFVLRRGTRVVQALQVTVSLRTSQATRQRELAGLESAMQAFDLDEGWIITLDEQEELTTAQGQTVHVVPVWRWLLGQ